MKSRIFSDAVHKALGRLIINSALKPYVVTKCPIVGGIKKSIDEHKKEWLTEIGRHTGS